MLIGSLPVIKDSCKMVGPKKSKLIFLVRRTLDNYATPDPGTHIVDLNSVEAIECCTDHLSFKQTVHLFFGFLSYFFCLSLDDKLFVA